MSRLQPGPSPAAVRNGPAATAASLFRAFFRRPIYLARIASAAAQLLVVVLLGRESHLLLGIYSAHTALLAVLSQAVQFEGTSLAIGRVLTPTELRRIYRSTNFIWSVALLALFALEGPTPLALLFSLAFTLNMGSEWAVNLSTLSDRLERRDGSFHRTMLIKILVIDTVLPGLLAVPVLLNASSTIILGLCAVLLGANGYIAIRFVGYPRRLSDFRLPNWHLVYGVVVKRTDGVFIRLFTGATLGVAALGGIQLLLSIGRTLNMLTPTWLSVNVGRIVERAKGGHAELRRTVRFILLTYLAYVAFAMVLFASTRVVQWSSSSLAIMLLVVLFFGNQNTKAFLRQQDLVSGRVASNNLAVTAGLAGKAALALLLLTYGLFGVLLAVFLVDAFIIGLMLVAFTRSLQR